MVKALSNLGYAASLTGDLERAKTHYEEALAVAEAPRDRVVALNSLSDLALRARDLDRARELAQQARRDAVDDESAGVASFNLGYTELLAGRRPEAARNLQDAARIFDALGDQETVALALDGLAIATDDPDRAAQLVGGAEARREAVGARGRPSRTSCASTARSRARTRAGRISRRDRAHARRAHRVETPLNPIPQPPIQRMGNNMATGFASALSEGQPAQLDLGDEAVPCLVVGFSGADVVLAPGGAIPEDALAPGNTSYLLIEADGTLQALKAHVRPGYTEGELVATLLDPFRLGQRRNFSRAPLVLPAHVRPAGDTEDPTTTFTRDISAGGLRIARQSGYREADLHEVVLGLVQANREIRVTAETVRVTPADVSLSFTDIEAEDRLLLAQLTFAYHRRRAGQ